MKLKLYDTLSKETKELHPMDGQRYRFYCCGPTVYGPAHIGNFRTFLIQDVLLRVLKLAEKNPYFVRNLTDVDDKTIRGSMKEGLTLEVFTQKWTEKFHQDCKKLNMLAPDQEPTATGHIKEQIEMIEKLVKTNHAYVAHDGSVYYKVRSFKFYGKLSHINLDNLQTQGETSAGAMNLADEYDRENVADFALWKAWKEEDGENFWDSPWGKGRPGWHIECSAMSRKYLGDTFDLHGGGIDLCFPHHENEIAQSEAFTGKEFSKHWFHCAHLRVEGEKMSKSLGNLFTLDDLEAKDWSPFVVRYLLTSGSYRHPLNFTFEGLSAAKSALQKMEKLAEYLMNIGEVKDFKAISVGKNFGPFNNFWNALCDDLNVPAGLGELFKTAKQLEHEALSKSDAVSHLESFKRVLYALGLELFTQKKSIAPEDIQILAQMRWDAKKAKNWAESDRLRNEIESKGWKILDHEAGFDLESKK